MLRERIVRRPTEGRDASDGDLAVLDHQLRGQEPLAPDEHADVVAYDAECTLECARVPGSWLPALERIEAASRAIADRQGACCS
jgi:hypothetical protein